MLTELTELIKQSYWTEIETLRKKQIELLNNGHAEDASINKMIEDDLNELQSMGDYDASAQLAIEQINLMLSNCNMSRCEAFALAMQCFAEFIENEMKKEQFPSPFPGPLLINRVLDKTLIAFNTRLIQLAWGYLASNSEQNRFDQPGTRIFHKILQRFRRNHLFQELLDARASADQPSTGTFNDDPQIRILSWSDVHDEIEGGPGSGWFPPLKGDTELKNAKSGKHDHALANLIAGWFIPQIIGYLKLDFALLAPGIITDLAVLPEELTETSITDEEINEVSRFFALYLAAKKRSPAEIGDWIRKHFCTEINLNGIWEVSWTGPPRFVRIDHDLRANDVKATYLEEHVCEHLIDEKNRTVNISKSYEFFAGKFDPETNQIKGKINVCVVK